MHVAAYAKTYVMLKKYGIEPVHFPEKHLAVVSLQGKLLLQAAKKEIERLLSSPRNSDASVLLDNFRNPERTLQTSEVVSFAVSPLRIRRSGSTWENWSLAGKRIAIAPASALSRELLSNPDLRDATIVAYFDRDSILHGKSINNVPILPYSAIPETAPDFILVAAPEHHKNDIVLTITSHLGDPSRVAALDISTCETSS
jgi:hypothetical protein